MVEGKGRDGEEGGVIPTVIMSILAATQAPVLPDSPAKPPVALAEKPPSAEQIALARDIIVLVLPPEQRKAQSRQTLDAFMRNMVAGIMQNGELDALFAKVPATRDIFGAFVTRQRDLALADLEKSTPELIEAYVGAYAKNFSVAELRDLKTFFAAPTGAHYASILPNLLNDPGVAEWQRGVAARAQARQKDQLDQLKADISEAVKASEQKDGHS